MDCCVDVQGGPDRDGFLLHTSGCPNRCAKPIPVSYAHERGFPAAYPCGTTDGHGGDCWIHPSYRLTVRLSRFGSSWQAQDWREWKPVEETPLSELWSWAFYHDPRYDGVGGGYAYGLYELVERDDQPGRHRLVWIRGDEE